jgi:hypothetical protein
MDSVGRPTKQTPEIVAKLCDALAHGLNNADAAACAGIGERTLYEWLEDPEFVAVIASAKAMQKLALVKMVTEGKPGWPSAAWRLERLDLNFCRPEVRLLFLQHEEAKKREAGDDREQLLKDLALVAKISPPKELNGETSTKPAGPL